MMTASLRPSSAADRLTHSASSALLALLVQALFIGALLLWAVPPLSLPRAEREIIFHFVPATPPAPPVRIIGAPSAPTRKPVASAPTPSSVTAPPSGIAGFGQSLFGCAPGNQDCPKPGDGMAQGQPDDLMGGHSHVKDNARWANAMAHKQTLRMMPGGLLFPLVALGAVLDGSITEPHSAFRDPEQWPDERDPRQFLPRSLDEQDRINDAWNREHATPAADCAPQTGPGASRDRPADARSPCPALPPAPASATSPPRPGSP